MDGEPAGAIEVLGAGNLQAILDRLDMSSRVASQDARIVKERTHGCCERGTDLSRTGGADVAAAAHLTP